MWDDRGMGKLEKKITMIMINEDKAARAERGCVWRSVAISHLHLHLIYASASSTHPSDPITELTPFKCLRRNSDAWFGMIGEAKKKDEHGS